MLKRGKLYALDNVPSTDSLRAAQAIFKKHSNDLSSLYYASSTSIRITVTDEPLLSKIHDRDAKLAAMTAVATTNSIDTDDNDNDSTHSLMMDPPIPLTNYKSTSNSSSVSLVSVSSSRGSIINNTSNDAIKKAHSAHRIITPHSPVAAAKAAAYIVNESMHSPPDKLYSYSNDGISNVSLNELDHSLQMMNLLDVPGAKYHYSSKLQHVKDKFHKKIHIKHNSVDYRDNKLLPTKKSNKLKKTLRNDNNSSETTKDDIYEVQYDSSEDENDILDDDYKENDILTHFKKKNNSSDKLSRNSPEYFKYHDDNSQEHHKYRKVMKRTYKTSTKKFKKTLNLSPTSKYGNSDKTKKNKKKCFNEDKPWKAHRDVNFINFDERRRYEAMWMSNRFRYLTTLHWWPPTDNADILLPQDGLILALVVQKIWKRSNLSNALLANIFDLVDCRKDGTLDRRSFIVGMWLVDQCLYGRKLPPTVPQEVWNSVDRFAVNVAKNDKINLKTKKKIFKKDVKMIKKTRSTP